MARPNLQLRFAHSPVLRYGLAAVSSAIALGLALLTQRYGFRNIEVPLFLFAIAVTVWYAGIGPAILAVVLSSLAFDYFFTEPRYTLYVRSSELPYYAVFILFALLLTWFSAVRRRVEQQLLQSRDELQNLNQELAKRSTELESINKELEAFAYSISHDLRAPLRHMAGYTELLQKRASSCFDEKSNHYITMMLESAKRMGNLIDDLLAFSRIGRAETQKTLVNLAQLVREALSEVREETEGRNIAWKIGTLPDFYGDRSMLRLVLVNLISNAVKFTRTRPQAEIEIGSANGNRDELIVFVRDNGVGFDMKYVNKLFGVFQRLHQAAEFEGTGIGLATVQRIIHRHGGKVWAEGVVNSGATFYFSAPRPQGHLWRTRTN
jgi:signal transduction histidine kinase